MAITILSSPYSMAPAYNPIVFTVTSSNVSQCSFRYIADIYVGGSFAKRLKLFPNLSGYAEFKLSRILQDYVSFNTHENLYGFTTNGSCVCDYVVKFGEEYDTSLTCDQPTTIFTNLTTTSTFYAFNGAIQHKEWLSFDFNVYSTKTSTPGKFMHFWAADPVSGKRAMTIGPGQQLVANIMSNSATATDQVARALVTTKDFSGATHTFAFACTIGNPTVTARRILSVGIGPQNINNTILSSGSQPVIVYGTTKYYTVVLQNSSNVAVSETLQFNLDYRPTRHQEPIRLSWLNRLGAFDAYTFTLLKKRSVNVKRQEFTKLIGGYNGSGSWTYGVKDRGRTTTNVQGVEAMTCNSNWLTEGEALWLEELFTSPESYLWDVNGNVPCGVSGTPTLTLYPIIMTSSAFEEKLKVNRKNISYTIDFEKAHEKQIQRN